jgi:hypothetical protein
MALINKLSAIGEAIREKTGKEDLLTLEQMPEEIRGISGGGEDSYYDVFWDNFQENGNRTDYAHGFSGIGWDDETFKPKYPIKVVSGESMFRKAQITELPAGLVDWSYYNKSLYGSDMFLLCAKLKIIYDAIDISNIGRFNNMFSGCTALETVSFEGSNAGANWSLTFNGCSSLKDVRFNGEIARTTSIPPSFKDSPLLTNESVQSIIDALADLTGVTTKTIVFHADVKVRMTETQIATITNKNWTLA